MAFSTKTTAAAILLLLAKVLSQNCAPVPVAPPAGVKGENCHFTLSPTPPGPRSSGPCGTPCYENSWYGNDSISPVKDIPILTDSCIPFACGYNYTNWRRAIHGHQIGYPSNASIPKAFAVECISELQQSRVLVSNGLPSKFAFLIYPPFVPCEVPFFVKLPLNPQVVNDTVGAFEVPLRGPIGMSLQGVAIFNAQDAGGADAVASGIAPWVGHATPGNLWHYHHSAPPLEPHTVVSTYPKETELVGYALDGFPIYGPLHDDSNEKLDVCNGRWVGGEGDGNKKYQYHMKKVSTIDTSSPYCVDWETSIVNQWNYFLGCYSGSPLNSLVTSYIRDTTVLPLSRDYKCKVHVGKKKDVRHLIGGDSHKELFA